MSKLVKLIGGPMDGKELYISDNSSSLIYPEVKDEITDHDAIYVWNEDKTALVYKDD